jgi:hypothetical protein
LTSSGARLIFIDGSDPGTRHDFFAVHEGGFMSASTSYVEEEINIVLPRYRFKTIFVIDAKGREGLARRARELDPSDSANDIVSVADSTECVRLVGGLLLGLKAVPTRKAPLAGLLADKAGAKELTR